MGKIFGISDNPVSTIDKVFKRVEVPKPKEKSLRVSNNHTETDKFVSKEKQNAPNAFVKMRNGFGKLMSHFSHPKKKSLIKE